MVGFNRRYAPDYAALRDQPRDVCLMQKHRRGPLDGPRRTVFDDFIHVVDTLLFLAPVAAERVTIETVVRDGLLQSVTLMLASDRHVAIGSMNRDSGLDEERLDVIGGGRKHSVLNLSERREQADGIESLDPASGLGSDRPPARVRGDVRGLPSRRAGRLRDGVGRRPRRRTGCAKTSSVTRRRPPAAGNAFTKCSRAAHDAHRSPRQLARRNRRRATHVETRWRTDTGFQAGAGDRPRLPALDPAVFDLFAELRPAVGVARGNSVDHVGVGRTANHRRTSAGHSVQDDDQFDGGRERPERHSNHAGRAAADPGAGSGRAGDGAAVRSCAAAPSTRL